MKNKILIIYHIRSFYIKNAQLENTQGNYVFCSYYFVLCVEQLFSIFYVFNYISFYRKHPLNNAFFVIFNLLLLILISKIFEVKSNYVNKVKEEGIVKKYLPTVVIFVIMLLVNIPIGYTNVKNQYNTRAKLNNKFRIELSKYYSDLNEIKILALAFNPEVYMSTNMKLDFPCFFTMNNTYERASYYYQQQLKYVREEMADVVVIRPESTFIYFPIPMQEEIYNKLEESYERVEDIDSESNYGLYNIYKKKK